MVIDWDFDGVLVEYSWVLANMDGSITNQIHAHDPLSERRGVRPNQQLFFDQRDTDCESQTHFFTYESCSHVRPGFFITNDNCLGNKFSHPFGPSVETTCPIFRQTHISYYWFYIYIPLHHINSRYIPENGWLYPQITGKKQ